MFNVVIEDAIIINYNGRVTSQLSHRLAASALRRVR